MHVTRTITINSAPDRVYAFWRDFENLPRFTHHLAFVETNGLNRSHWVARKPGGGTVEWDAEITEDLPNEMIAWRSVGDDDDVQNSGAVHFTRAPGGRGTEIRVELDYDPPAARSVPSSPGSLARSPASS